MKIRFGSWEGTTLLINLITFKLLMSAIRVFTETAGTAGWIMAVYVCVIGLAVVNLMLLLLRRFVGCDILDITQMAFGETVKKIVGVLIAIMLSFNVLAVVKLAAESNKVVAFPQTPVELIQLFYILAAVLAAYAGFEAIVRVHGFAMPLVIAAYVLIFVFGVSQCEAENFLPILGNGADAIFLDGLFAISVFNEFIVFLLIIPFLGEYKIARRTALWSTGISTVLIVGAVAYYTSFVEFPVMNDILIPIYQITRLSGVSRFFQRFEAVFLITWVFTTILYASANLYLICHVLAKSFRLKNMKALILPVAAALFLAMETNRYHVGDTSGNMVYYKYVWIVALLIPLVSIVVATLRRRGKADEEVQDGQIE